MGKSELTAQVVDSLKCLDGNVNSTEDVLDWIKAKRDNTEVSIRKVQLTNDTFWFFDDTRGEILNRKRSFFSIIGLRHFENNHFKEEQPIILQNEIGFLGIIAKEINGVLNFLMQAKIEPGNINYVQISPTIQATKSNFTRAHGGNFPRYFEFFERASEHGRIIYDRFQSEQGNRFLAKQNRNIVVLTDEKIEVHPDYMWMTLGQIKSLLKMDNVVNMDSRTVISGIRCFEGNYESAMDRVQAAFAILNSYRMFHSVNNVSVPLNQLTQWNINPDGVFCDAEADFEIRYFDIRIAGRELQDWTQPLLCAKTRALFVLLYRNTETEREYLIHTQSEPGCADIAEFGPSVQLANEKMIGNLGLEQLIKNRIESGQGVVRDVLLSEEGGRFFEEQNRNLIIDVSGEDFDKFDILEKNGYIWVTYDVLMLLMNSGHCLNIQLRSLISMLTDFEGE